MYLAELSLVKLFQNICIKMPWYAVARGTKPGVYKTWDECAEHVKNFSGAKYRKFTTQEEALAFVKEFGFKNNAIKTEKTEMYEINTNRLEASPSKTQTNIPHVSSPKLKANALKQRLSIIEKLYEQSMSELRLEIDSAKERLENFDALTNVTSEMNEVTENFKSLQESLSKLANSYRDSVEELKREIGDLRTSIESLELEFSQQKTSDVSSYSHMSSFKRNLFNNAVVPVATKRLFSSNAVEPSKRKRRKRSTDNEDSHEVTTSTLSGFDLDENGFVKVYTDGACTKNGKVGARAGVGVYFGDGHPMNYSEPAQGRQTNNTAEIQAATCAIDLARRAGINKLVINTDSEFLINCITVWIHKWKKNGWKISAGESVKNKEDLIALEQAIEGMNVKWNHVRAHKGTHGNEMADALARAGAQKKR